jgi:hypothetical protein
MESKGNQKVDNTSQKHEAGWVFASATDLGLGD